MKYKLSSEVYKGLESVEKTINEMDENVNNYTLEKQRALVESINVNLKQVISLLGELMIVADSILNPNKKSN